MSTKEIQDLQKRILYLESKIMQYDNILNGLNTVMYNSVPQVTCGQCNVLITSDHVCGYVDCMNGLQRPDGEDKG